MSTRSRSLLLYIALFLLSSMLVSCRIAESFLATRSVYEDPSLARRLVGKPTPNDEIDKHFVLVKTKHAWDEEMCAGVVISRHKILTNAFCVVSEVDVEAEPVDPKLVTVQLDVTSKNKLRVIHITLSEAPSKELTQSDEAGYRLAVLELEKEITGTDEPIELCGDDKQPDEQMWMGGIERKDGKLEEGGVEVKHDHCPDEFNKKTFKNFFCTDPLEAKDSSSKQHEHHEKEAGAHHEGKADQPERRGKEKKKGEDKAKTADDAHAHNEVDAHGNKGFVVDPGSPVVDVHGSDKNRLCLIGIVSPYDAPEQDDATNYVISLHEAKNRAFVKQHANSAAGHSDEKAGHDKKGHEKSKGEKEKEKKGEEESDEQEENDEQEEDQSEEKE